MIVGPFELAICPGYLEHSNLAFCINVLTPRANIFHLKLLSAGSAYSDRETAFLLSRDARSDEDNLLLCLRVCFDLI